jgi:hypothetical protein
MACSVRKHTRTINGKRVKVTKHSRKTPLSIGLKVNSRNYVPKSLPKKEIDINFNPFRLIDDLDNVKEIKFLPSKSFKYDVGIKKPRIKKGVLYTAVLDGKKVYFATSGSNTALYTKEPKSLDDFKHFRWNGDVYTTKYLDKVSREKNKRVLLKIKSKNELSDSQIISELKSDIKMHNKLEYDNLELSKQSSSVYFLMRGNDFIHEITFAHLNYVDSKAYLKGVKFDLLFDGTIKKW